MPPCTTTHVTLHHNPCHPEPQPMPPYTTTHATLHHNPCHSTPQPIPPYTTTHATLNHNRCHPTPEPMPPYTTTHATVHHNPCHHTTQPMPPYTKTHATLTIWLQSHTHACVDLHWHVSQHQQVSVTCYPWCTGAETTRDTYTLVWWGSPVLPLGSMTHAATTRPME